MQDAMTKKTSEKWTPERIRRLRKRLKMTHDELAIALGVAPRTVIGWQSGRNKPRGLSCLALDLLDRGLWKGKP
jgi:DNA-binding transcriptional regulator YiaG